MRSAVPRALLLTAALFCVSCDDSAIDPSHSLVGAKSLPPANELSRETIQINRGYGDISIAFLSYELLPDDRLIVTLTDRNLEKDVVLGKDTFQLTPEIAADARRMLWRLRPDELQRFDEGGFESETRPVGCYRRGPHDFGELAIVFFVEGSQEGVDDDRLGVFEMPHPSSCRSPAALRARETIEHVMQLFPPSKLPTEFERRHAEFSD